MGAVTWRDGRRSNEGQLEMNLMCKKYNFGRLGNYCLFFFLIAFNQAKSALKNINFCLHSNAAYFREGNLCTGNKDMDKQCATHAHAKSQVSLKK